jgi:hypothetical protein
VLDVPLPRYSPAVEHQWMQHPCRERCGIWAEPASRDESGDLTETHCGYAGSGAEVTL